MLGGVDVGVSVVDVAELILGAVLGSSGGDWDSDGSSDWGVSSGVWENSGVAEGMSGVARNDSCASAGNDGQDDLEEDCQIR